MLNFDIDERDLFRIGGELDATNSQVRFAFGRALNRTAATLRRISERGLRGELELRTLKFLRVRMKTMKLKRVSNGQSVSLWYGLNAMPVGELKGRPKKTASGASFRGTEFKGGFVGRNKRGQPTIFKRSGAERLPIIEQELGIQEKAQSFLEDRVFDHVEEIFWKHFIADLSARVKYGLGQKGYYD